MTILKNTLSCLTDFIVNNLLDDFKKDMMSVRIF